MSISSDLSKNNFVSLQPTQQVEQAFQLERIQGAKVIQESADSNSTSDDSKQHSNTSEYNSRAIEPSEVEEVNIKMRQLSVGLSFEKTDDGKDSVVKVIDQVTGDLVRQIPSEEFLEMSKRIDDIFGELNELKGNLVNSQV